MTILKILVGILMLPIALAAIILAALIFGIVKAMEFAYGNIEFDFEDADKKE